MRIWERMALAVRPPSPAKRLEAVPQSKAERHGLCGMMVCSNSRFSPLHTKRVCSSVTTYDGSSRQVVAGGRRPLREDAVALVQSLSLIDYSRTRGAETARFVPANGVGSPRAFGVLDCG